LVNSGFKKTLARQRLSVKGGGDGRGRGL